MRLSHGGGNITFPENSFPSQTHSRSISVPENSFPEKSFPRQIHFRPISFPGQLIPNFPTYFIPCQFHSQENSFRVNYSQGKLIPRENAFPANFIPTAISFPWLFYSHDYLFNSRYFPGTRFFLGLNEVKQLKMF